jgi:hypothetical protein
VLSQHVRAGVSIVDSGRQLVLETDTPGIVVLAVSDKGNGGTRVRREAVVGPKCRLDIPCDPGMKSDRTLRVVLIAGATLSAWKDRL